MIKILIVEDHPGMKLLIKELLLREKDFSVVAEAEDGLTGFQRAHDLNPDLLITDLNLPRLHGLALIALVHTYCPDTRIVATSMNVDRVYVDKAIFNGAAAFVAKDVIYERLVPTVRKILSSPIAPSESNSKNRVQKGDPGRDESTVLSESERAIIEFLCKGYSNSEVVHCLKLSVREYVTVYARLLHRLKLNSQSELEAYARKTLRAPDLPKERI